MCIPVSAAEKAQIVAGVPPEILGEMIPVWAYLGKAGDGIPDLRPEAWFSLTAGGTEPFAIAQVAVMVRDTAGAPLIYYRADSVRLLN